MYGTQQDNGAAAPILGIPQQFHDWLTSNPIGRWLFEKPLPNIMPAQPASPGYIKEVQDANQSFRDLAAKQAKQPKPVAK